MNSKFSKFILWSALILFVCSISIGYANVTDMLNIQGTSEYTPPEGVFITEIQTVDGITINSFKGTVINSKADLGRVTSKTINVIVYNNSNVVYGYNVMKYAVGAGTYDNENIEITTAMKQKDENWKVEPYGYLTFPVTFSFKDGSDTSNAILNSIVEFEFLPFNEIPDNVEETTVSNAMDRFEQILNTPEEKARLDAYMENTGNDRNTSYISNVSGANSNDKAAIEELFSGNLHMNINGERHDVKIMIKREDVNGSYNGDEMVIYMTTNSLTSFFGKAVVYRCIYINDNGTWRRQGDMVEGTANICDYTTGSRFGTGSFNTDSWKAS